MYHVTLALRGGSIFPEVENFYFASETEATEKINQILAEYRDCVVFTYEITLTKIDTSTFESEILLKQEGPDSAIYQQYCC
jgi:hypothetical protein